MISVNIQNRKSKRTYPVVEIAMNRQPKVKKIVFFNPSAVEFFKKARVVRYGDDGFLIERGKRVYCIRIKNMNGDIVKVIVSKILKDGTEKWKIEEDVSIPSDKNGKELELWIPIDENFLLINPPWFEEITED